MSSLTNPAQGASPSLLARSAPATPAAFAEMLMGPAWRRLFDLLDACANPEELDETLLRSLLRAVPREECWIDHAAAFSEQGYRRNRIRVGPCYEALLMCWRPGQRSPIHDHAGSYCAVRVLRGIATETVYDAPDGGAARAAETRHHAAGSVCVSIDADTHEIANEQRGHRDLVTMHIYAPPLASMGGLPVVEPLRAAAAAMGNGFCGGDGI